jgi:DNA primase
VLDGGGGGGGARAYLERRGVGRGLAAEFGLGYAPESRDGLKRALLDQGFAEQEQVAAGLVALPSEDGGGGRGGGGGAYDRFRDRLMFPIADERGRIVGFGGRALGEARAKYLNTPETALFRKGELLYNLHRAAPAARERREIVLAEGYMDVIALAKAGVPQAVAPLGTAVTERQLGLLWRHAEAPLVCLDGDRAGLAAALRAAERALPLMQAGKTLRFAILPEGEDPDSFVARHGSAAMAEVLGRAQSLSQTLWRLETRDRSLDTPEAHAGLRRRLREYVRLTGDPDLRASLDVEFQRLLGDAFPRRARARPGWRRGRAGGRGPAGRRRCVAAAGTGQRVGSSRLAAASRGCGASAARTWWRRSSSTRDY